MNRLSLIIGVLIGVTAIAIVGATMDIASTAPNPVIGTELAVTAPQEPTLEITYIANEGVLISAGDKQVLIDGLHREYKRDYAFLPAAEREKIETAKAPFDKIDLILVSHLHLDHFHPESIGLHLKHNSGATLVTSQQVVVEVEKNARDYQAVKARVTTVTVPLKERVAMKAAGIDFEILGLGHGSGRFHWIQNLGHIIRLGGKKILHVGDAEASSEIFGKFNLDREGIDIAIVPAWFLLYKDGQRVVREHLRPKHIIAVHISPAEAEEAAGRINQFFPNAIAFTRMLEKRRY
jgi:L-ascorbate metabolism protein UlaG (beta-lactamase superfamily)